MFLNLHFLLYAAIHENAPPCIMRVRYRKYITKQKCIASTRWDLKMTFSGLTFGHQTRMFCYRDDLARLPYHFLPASTVTRSAFLLQVLCSSRSRPQVVEMDPARQVLELLACLSCRTRTVCKRPVISSLQSEIIV